MTSRFGLLKRARKYYRDLDYPRAVEILESDRFSDDPVAHYMLAEIYAYGSKRETGLARDARRAMKHYKEASRLGYAEASYEVAKNYQVGDGVKENQKKAAEYFRLAIEQGHVIAKYQLADVYIDYFPERIPEAIDLLESIIQDGEYEGLACTMLGRLYLRGKGVDPDYQVARAWFEKGTEYQHSSSYLELAYIYFQGLGVDRDPNRALKYVELAGDDHIMYEEAKEAILKQLPHGSWQH